MTPPTVSQPLLEQIWREKKESDEVPIPGGGKIRLDGDDYISGTVT
jgi:hypothetical protein